jgi:isopenicillin-N N-acyltransferase-like protein
VSALPVLDLRGGPREVGRGHGEAAREAIAHNLDLYLERFGADAGLGPADVRRRGALALAGIDALDPDYGQTVRGIAEGSGRSPAEVAALNVRYEILYSAYTEEVLGARRPATGADGCTAFAALPEATPDGHLRLGQNWDWLPGVAGVLLRVTRPDGFRVLAFTEAGIAGGKIGLNAAGVGLAINGLASDRDDWRRPGLPFHVRAWRALNAPTLAGAVAAVEGGERACAANFLLAGADETGAALAVDVETAPGATCRLTPGDGVLVHANHFAGPVGETLRETLEPTSTSFARGARMAALLGASRGRLDAATLQTILADHEGYPGSICAHPDATLPADETFVTAVSVVMDLTAGEMRVAAGNPCVTPFRRLTLA